MHSDWSTSVSPYSFLRTSNRKQRSYKAIHNYSALSAPILITDTTVNQRSYYYIINVLLYLIHFHITFCICLVICYEAFVELGRGRIASMIVLCASLTSRKKGETYHQIGNLDRILITDQTLRKTLKSLARWLHRSRH